MFCIVYIFLFFVLAILHNNLMTTLTVIHTLHGRREHEDVEPYETRTWTANCQELQKSAATTHMSRKCSVRSEYSTCPNTIVAYSELLKAIRNCSLRETYCLQSLKHHNRWQKKHKHHWYKCTFGRMKPMRTWRIIAAEGKEQGWEVWSRRRKDRKSGNNLKFRNPTFALKIW